MPRLFIADPNLKSLHGHYYGYAARVARAAEALGVQPVILGSTALNLPTVTPPVLPSFTHDYWQEMVPAGRDPYVHLAERALRFAHELTASLEGWGANADDALFLPYVNLVELDGLGRVAERMGDAVPRLALLFRRELDEQGLDAGVGPRTVGALLRRSLGTLQALPAGARLRVFTDSDVLTDDYTERLQVRVQTAPIPVDERFTVLAGPRPAAPIVISYFGDARGEKGYQRLPGMAERLRPSLERGQVRLVAQSNFNVPGGEPGMAEARRALAEYRGIALLQMPLHDDEYALYLGESHLIVLPYEAERYVARTSGILAEAVHAGVPMIVPEGTWLSEQLRRHGAGVTFDARRPGGFEDAVERALASLSDLLTRAADRRGSFVAFHNPDRLARFVCGAAVLESGRQALQAESAA
jgi:glycosyltransferase involved in cell wall biosynthesis